jgi:integrase
MIRLAPKARDRILTDEELRTVWAAAEGAGVIGRYIRFLLLTGARRAEASHMRWEELDGSDWLLPASRNKTGLPLLRPPSPAALAAIGDRPEGAEFVFSLNGGSAPIAGYGDLKAAIDRATGEIDHWTLHDLRRTARSLLSRVDVSSDHAERVLGHVIGGVRGVYDRYEYREQKRAALAKLAWIIDRIVNDLPTVVKLRRVGEPADA